MTPAELAAWSTTIEQGVGEGATHRELAKAYGEELASRPEGDPRHEVARHEQMLFDLFLPDDPEFRQQWGPLAPMMTSGSACYPPRVVDFPESSVAHFRLREALARVPAARARLQDFLWLRERDHKMARLAIESYADAFQSVFNAGDHPLDALDYLRRALDLARSLSAMSEELTELVISHIEAALSEQSLGYVCRIVETGVRELGTDPPRALAVLEGLRRRAAAAAAVGGLQRHDQRSFLETGAILARELRDEATTRRFTEDAARSLEREACERSDQGPLIEMALLQKAVEAYANAGMPEDLERAKALLHHATTRGTRELKKVSTSVNVPRAQFEKHVDSLVEIGRQIGDGGVFYALAVQSGLWPDWAEVEAQTEQLKRDHPLQCLIQKVHLGPDGQQLPRPADDAAAKLFDEADVYMQRVQLALQFVAPAISILEQRGLWAADELLAAIVRSPLFADVTDAIRCGVQAFSEDRHWEAVHVLVPQIERALRSLAQMVGVDVYSFETKTGRVRWRPLDQLLEATPLQLALSQVRPSLAIELDVLLTDAAGLNLRNDVAHGVLTDTGKSYGHSLICVLILVLLGTLRLPDGAAEAAPEDGAMEPPNSGPS